MKEAMRKICNNASLIKFFREAVMMLPAIDETIINLYHYQIVEQTINARAGQVFKFFH